MESQIARDMLWNIRNDRNPDRSADTLIGVALTLKREDIEELYRECNWILRHPDSYSDLVQNAAQRVLIFVGNMRR